MSQYFILQRVSVKKKPLCGEENGCGDIVQGSPKVFRGEKKCIKKVDSIRYSRYISKNYLIMDGGYRRE